MRTVYYASTTMTPFNISSMGFGLEQDYIMNFPQPTVPYQSKKVVCSYCNRRQDLDNELCMSCGAILKEEIEDD